MREGKGRRGRRCGLRAWRTGKGASDDVRAVRLAEDHDVVVADELLHLGGVRACVVMGRSDVCECERGEGDGPKSGIGNVPADDDAVAMAAVVVRLSELP